MAKTIKIKGTKNTASASASPAKAKPQAKPQEAPKGQGKLSKPQEAPQAPKEAKPQRPKLADVPKGERTTEKLRSMYGARVIARWQNDGIDYPGTIIAPMPHHHLDGQPAPTIPENHVRVFFRAFPEYGWPLETWADIRTENIRAPGEDYEAPQEAPKEAPKGRKLSKGSDPNEKGGKLAKKAARKPTTRKR